MSQWTWYNCNHEPTTLHLHTLTHSLTHTHTHSLNSINGTEMSERRARLCIHMPRPASTYQLG
jgi:hypothetical protein